MKKIICVCLCICLISGCDKSFNHGRPVNAVAEDKGSEGVSPHSLTSNTPAPTSESSKSAPSSDSAVSSSLLSWHWWFPTININNSIVKYAVNIGVYSLAVYYGVYKPLYRFAKIKKPIHIALLKVVSPSDTKLGYLMCRPQWGHFFNAITDEYIDAIPVNVYLPHADEYRFYYEPNSSKLKALKTLLRKIFGIKTPVFKKRGGYSSRALLKKSSSRKLVILKTLRALLKIF